MHERRFAGTRGTHDRRQGFAPELHVDVVEGDDAVVNLAIAFAQIDRTGDDRIPSFTVRCGLRAHRSLP